MNPHMDTLLVLVAIVIAAFYLVYRKIRHRKRTPCGCPDRNENVQRIQIHLPKK
jgi:hypothetical protein